MTKNTKVVKTNSKVVEWFNSRRNIEKRTITAIISVNDTEAKVEPEIRVKSKTRNIDVVQRVLTEANGRISIDDAVKKFLDIHPMRSTRPEIAAKTAFLQAESHGVNVKIEKEDKITYIQLA